MDHLNFFNSYKNKAHHHEDELTRTFLTLVKNIPAVQVLFFELIRKEMQALDLPAEEQLESIALGELAVQSVNTQLGNTNQLFMDLDMEGYKVVSVIISDDRLDDEVSIQNDTRNARYDGVIFANPGWLFIIENKPIRDNIWVRQLNPTFQDGVKVIEKPCALSWRDVIEKLNHLVINGVLRGLELQLVEDFIEFVDHEFTYINPYTQFGVCKGEKNLLDKRCVALLESLVIDGEPTEVKYHRGWKHYVRSNRHTIQQIALDAHTDGNDWSISLWLYAGDTMSSAKATYRTLNANKLKQLEQHHGFTLWKNFHLAFRSSNLLWLEGKLSFDKYIAYWLKHAPTLKQAKREQFTDLFEQFKVDGITVPEDYYAIQQKVLNKNFQRLNICPGIGIKYTWTSEDASNLDQRNEFLEDLKAKIALVFEAVGDEIVLG